MRAVESWERNLVSPRRQEELQQQRGRFVRMQQAVCQGRVHRGWRPGWQRRGPEPSGCGRRAAWEQEPWLPAELGLTPQSGLLEPGVLPSSGSPRPHKPPSEEEARQRQTTAAGCRGRADRGPRPSFPISGPRGAGAREAWRRLPAAARLGSGGEARAPGSPRGSGRRRGRGRGRPWGPRPWPAFPGLAQAF
uniref:Uncharacterized protein n=1 Tax=Pipistrellus kuhlii TaxID=59472 RepID=A0A7J7U879_PIPKU|nr:hypothetical protein mPipKuh1_009178 [Pipistrellus kuhlii]